MIIDLIIALIGASLAYLLGYTSEIFYVFIAAFIIDIDLIIYETNNIMRGRKQLNFSSIIDEMSYQHKFILHLPLIIVPLIFVLSLIFLDLKLAILITLMFLSHFIHDSCDQNFDGVP